MEQINHQLAVLDREKAGPAQGRPDRGRETSPTLAIIDAQSVKCDAPQGERGYDAAKKAWRARRHGSQAPCAQWAVDSGGRLLAVRVTTADVQTWRARRHETVAYRWSSGWCGFAPGSGRSWSMAATKSASSTPCRRVPITLSMLSSARCPRRISLFYRNVKSGAEHRGVDRLTPSQLVPNYLETPGLLFENWA